MKTLHVFCLALAFNVWAPAGWAGDTDLAKAVNLDKLNTAGDEADPFPATDGLYYASNSNKAERWEIMLAKKNASGVFTTGKMYQSSKEGDYRSPYWFAGSLYFAHNKVPDEKLKDLKNYDLVKLMPPRAPLPLPGVSEKEDELYPWITPAGKEFYFSRKTDDGWKLFVALGPSPGPIGKAKEVGFPAGYHHATLGATGMTMFLEGPLEGGKIGIFRSKCAKVGAAWSMPEELKALNHPKSERGDMMPALTADGARLYFVSDRPGGKGGFDIWTLPLKDLK